MPIELLVNGFYRSGTTMLWRLLKESVDSQKSIVFYEPCHPNINQLVQSDSNKPNDWHGLYLWEEYLSLDKNVREKLFSKVVKGKVFPRKYEEISEYVDLYNDLDKLVYLQVNRYHYLLGEIYNVYRCKVIHVIRNPIDVYRSMERMYIENGFGWRKTIRSLLYKVGRENPLGIRNEYHVDSQERFESNLSTFEMFLTVWIRSNAFALDCVRNDGFLVVSYENIVSGDAVERIEKLIGFRLRSSIVREEKLSASYKYHEIKDETLNKIGLKSEYSRIIREIGVKE